MPQKQGPHSQPQSLQFAYFRLPRTSRALNARPHQYHLCRGGLRAKCRGIIGKQGPFFIAVLADYKNEMHLDTGFTMSGDAP